MPVVKGILMAMLFAFVAWCIREAVVQYRFERKMQKMSVLIRARHNWAWRRKGYIWPLFHEQRRKE